LFRPLYIVTDDINHSQDAQDFVKFVLSDEGQNVIAKAGTVNMAEGKPLEPMWASKKEKLGL
jgi:ABC-type Fe3+ transport system substrate-binding protein